MSEVSQFDMMSADQAVQWALANPGKYTVTYIESWKRSNRVLARLEIPRWYANVLMGASTYSKLVPGSN